MIRPTCTFLLLILATAILVSSSTASIFLPGSSSGSFGVSRARSLVDSSSSSSNDDAIFHRRRSYDRALQKYKESNPNGSTPRHPLAMAIPGNGVAEQVFIGGFGNFISIYNTVITARILLSWFPQAQGIGALQPVYQITDPYLNLFRGIIPPIFGLDLSPILAFVTLNLLQSSAVSLAAEIPKDMISKDMRMKFEEKRKIGQEKMNMKLGDI